MSATVEEITFSQCGNHTAQQMEFSIKDFSSKFDQIRSFLWIWSHLLEKSVKENFIFLCSECINCAMLKIQPSIIHHALLRQNDVHVSHSVFSCKWLVYSRLSNARKR